MKTRMNLMNIFIAMLQVFGLSIVIVGLGALLIKMAKNVQRKSKEELNYYKE